MIFAANFVIKLWPIADKCCDKGKWNNIFTIMMFKYLVAASFTPLEISIFSSETLKLRLWVEFLISTNGVFSVLLEKYFGLVGWIIKHCVVNTCVFFAAMFFWIVSQCFYSIALMALQYNEQLTRTFKVLVWIVLQCF